MISVLEICVHDGGGGVGLKLSAFQQLSFQPTPSAKSRLEQVLGRGLGKVREEAFLRFKTEGLLVGCWLTL